MQAAKGAGVGARRFVAIGNLLGFQTKQLFPTTQGRNYEKTTLLEPLWDLRLDLRRHPPLGLRTESPIAANRASKRPPSMCSTV